MIHIWFSVLTASEKQLSRFCLSLRSPSHLCLSLCLCPTHPPPPNSLCSLFFSLCAQCIMTVSPSFPSCSLLDISFDSSLHPSLIPSPLSDSSFGHFGHQHIFSCLLTLSATVNPFVLPSSETQLAIGSRCAESTAITHLHELVIALHR